VNGTPLPPGVPIACILSDGGMSARPKLLDEFA
jgi:hypothetical protein